MEIGKVVAGQTEAGAKKRPRKKSAVVILDPGLSFGTGQHPTTSFLPEPNSCAVVKLARPQSFLDIGTGSGFLPSRRRSLVISRFMRLILTRKPSAWRVENAPQTAWTPNSS